MHTGTWALPPPDAKTLAPWQQLLRSAQLQEQLSKGLRSSAAANVKTISWMLSEVTSEGIR